MEENPKDSTPFISIAVASFDLLSGVKVVHKWLYTDNLKIPLEDIFKMTLTNVHRQKEEAFLNLVASSTDIQSIGWLVISSLFVINKKPHNTYYSVSLILESDEISKQTNIMELLSCQCRDLAYAAKEIITKNEPIQRLNFFVDKAHKECTFLINSRILELPPIEPAPIDSSFLTLVLSSHLQTQMTTIIECSDPEESFKVASFLSHFTLPYQRAHSSLEIRETPVPGLFLQCVQKQNLPPEDILIKFRMPCTLITIDEHSRTVVQAPVADAQNRAHAEYTQILVLDEASQKKKLQPLKNHYKSLITRVTAPAPWAMATLSIVMQMPQGSQALVCSQQLESIVRMALTEVALVEERAAPGQYMTPDQVNELWKTLRLTGRDDLSLVTAVAQIFDKGMQRKVFMNRRDAFLQITNVY